MKEGTNPMTQFPEFAYDFVMEIHEGDLRSALKNLRIAHRYPNSVSADDIRDHFTSSQASRLRKWLIANI